MATVIIGTTYTLSHLITVSLEGAAEYNAINSKKTFSRLESVLQI